MSFGWAFSLALAVLCFASSIWLYRAGERRTNLTTLMAAEMSLVIVTACLAFGGRS